MLKLILGRAGCGKTTTVLKRLCQAGQERRQVLMVPEQQSHQAERALCKAGGDEVSLYAEVLSFSRLANRVFLAAGGVGEPELDSGGRLLLMYQAVKAVSQELTVYARPSRRPAFLENLLATVDELKSCCVQPQLLLQAGEEVEGPEGDKLRDLGLICGAYQALTARTALDPRDPADPHGGEALCLPLGPGYGPVAGRVYRFHSPAGGGACTAHGSGPPNHRYPHLRPLGGGRGGHGNLFSCPAHCCHAGTAG